MKAKEIIFTAGMITALIGGCSWSESAEMFPKVPICIMAAGMVAVLATIRYIVEEYS